MVVCFPAACGPNRGPTDPVGVKVRGRLATLTATSMTRLPSFSGREGSLPPPSNGDIAVRRRRVDRVASISFPFRERNPRSVASTFPPERGARARRGEALDARPHQPASPDVRGRAPSNRAAGRIFRQNISISIRPPLDIPNNLRKIQATERFSWTRGTSTRWWARAHPRRLGKVPQSGDISARYSCLHMKQVDLDVIYGLSLQLNR